MLCGWHVILGVFHMLLRIMAIAITGSLLWACSSTPEEAATASSSGEPATASAPADSSSQQPSVTSETTSSPGVRAGTVEDFVVNVGDRVLFGTDRFDLSSDSRDVLRRQSRWLVQYPSVGVTIAGHADERGTREYNLALGERRAIAVKNYLVALGIDSRRMRTISYGKERPVDARSVSEAWAKNRRGVTQIEDATLSLSN